MSRIGDLNSVLAGEKPQRMPFISFGFWDEKAMLKLAPPECCDENMLHLLSDDPPRDVFSPEERTSDSRERAIRMGNFLDTCSLGVGKGGLLQFGHGGPGEIQPHVIERTATHKILQYEGGHKRRVNFDPYAVHYFDFPVHTIEDVERLELPDMRDPARYADIAGDCEAFTAADFMPAASIQGFFSGIHNSFMDYQDTMEALLLNPDLIARLTERLVRMSLDAVEMLLARGVRIINVCDDLGTAKNMIISPRLFRRFFLPWYEELVHVVHGAGAYVHMHSHGNIAPILGDLGAAGIDIMNPFDWTENPDLPALCEKVGKYFVICGGLEPNMSQYDLADFERVVRRAADLAPHCERGYIMMDPGANSDTTLDQHAGWRQVFQACRV